MSERCVPIAVRVRALGFPWSGRVVLAGCGLYLWQSRGLRWVGLGF